MLFDIILPIIIVANIIFAILVIFIQRKNPTAVAAWLLVLFLLPVLGFFLFLIFGQDYRKKRMFSLKEQNDQEYTGYIREQKKELDARKKELHAEYPPAIEQMVRMLLDSNRAIVTVANDITLYTDGTKKFNDVIAAIRDAKDHIHMEYFILKDDGLGREIISALEERARAGVDVRLLVDGVGSAHLPRRFFRGFENAGGKHAVFFPSLIPYVNYRVNYRNHRKIGVIDGKTAFIGGFNIGDDYVGKDPRWGYWRDCAVRIRGTGAYAAQLRFLLDWNYAAGGDSIEFIGEGHMKSRYFPEMDHFNGAVLQVVSGGPDTRWNAVKESYIKIINSATESVYLQTPYFIPDESVTDALRIAALSGVDVRIMIPNQPDHMFVYWTSHSYVEELLDSGVRAYCYNNGFLHAKTIVIDGNVASVGSANWDMRSFHLNFETNAVIYNPAIAGELRQAFLDDLKVCTELTPGWYRSRSWFFRTRASVCRLFTPIL